MHFLLQLSLIHLFLVVIERSGRVDGSHSKSRRRANLFTDELCGIQVYPGKVRGGQLTEIDEYPWMVLLVHEREDGISEFDCGGALINGGRHVLTAAHCVNRTRKKLKHVRLGEYNYETDIDCIQEKAGFDCADKPVDLEVESVIVHPNYSGDTFNSMSDIALLRLKGAVEYTDFIRPICLPPENLKLHRIKTFTVAGWGRTDLYEKAYGNIQSPIKLKLELPQVRHSNCRNIYKRLGLRIGPGQLCAGGEDARDACPGDSGSPLMYFDPNHRRWIIVGIVSLGMKDCGTSGYPGVYTDVHYHMNWIVNNLRSS